MRRSTRSLNVRQFALIVAIDVLESIAELCFKSATTATGIHNVTLANLAEFMARLLTSGPLWIGVACFLVIFCLWMTVLTKVDLSVAFPLGNAVYILIPLLAVVVLRERIPPIRWLGTLFVVVGSSCVSASATNAER